MGGKPIHRLRSNFLRTRRIPRFNLSQWAKASEAYLGIVRVMSSTRIADQKAPKTALIPRLAPVT